MRWILHIATYVIAFLWGLNHKRKEDPSIFDDEFIGYEAFSSQTFMPTSRHKEYHDSTLIKNRDIQ
jgi:hypothetical protein